jgi:hypothetical protein
VGQSPKGGQVRRTVTHPVGSGWAPSKGCHAWLRAERSGPESDPRCRAGVVPAGRAVAGPGLELWSPGECLVGDGADSVLEALRRDGEALEPGARRRSAYWCRSQALPNALHADRCIQQYGLLRADGPARRGAMLGEPSRVAISSWGSRLRGRCPLGTGERRPERYQMANARRNVFRLPDGVGGVGARRQRPAAAPGGSVRVGSAPGGSVRVRRGVSRRWAGSGRAVVTFRPVRWARSTARRPDGRSTRTS